MVFVRLLLAASSIFVAQSSATYSCRAKKHEPSGVSCNTRGFLNSTSTDPFGSLPIFAKTFDDCVHIILGGRPSTTATAFSWSSQNGSCLEYTFFGPTFTPDPQGTTFLSNTDCWHCKSTCPDPAGTGNILFNGNFNLSNTFFGPWYFGASNGIYAFPLVSSGSRTQ